MAITKLSWRMKKSYLVVLVAALGLAIIAATVWPWLKIRYVIHTADPRIDPPEVLQGQVLRLVSLGPDVVPHLVPWLEAEHTDRNFVAGCVLIVLGEDAVDEVSRLVLDLGTPRGARKECVLFLGHFQSMAEVRQVFRTLSQDQDPDVRALAIRCVGHWKTGKMRPHREEWKRTDLDLQITLPPVAAEPQGHKTQSGKDVAPASADEEKDGSEVGDDRDRTAPENDKAAGAPPKTVEEAVDRLLATMSDKDRLVSKKAPEMDFIARHHHGQGRWIRNNFLARGNKELMEACKKRAGGSLGVYPPDRASCVILGALWDKLQTLPLEDEERAWRLWKMAENYFLNHAEEPGKAKLREIVRKHPNSDHAKMAREKLKLLDGEAE